MSLFEQKIFKAIEQSEDLVKQLKRKLKNIERKYKAAMLSNNILLADAYKKKFVITEERIKGLNQEIHDCRKHLTSNI